MFRPTLWCSLLLVSCAAPPRERTAPASLPLVREALRTATAIRATPAGHAFDVAPLGARVSSGALRVAASEDLWIELTPLDDVAPRPVQEGLALVAREVRPATDVLWIGGRGRVEELRVLRDESAPTLTHYRLALGPAVARVVVREGRLDVLDARDRVALAGERLIAADARGETRDLAITLERDVLTLALDASGLRFPVVVDPAWTAVASMATQRSRHHLAVLPDGKVLASGGENGGAALSTTEVYDPAANTWTAGPSMSVGRSAHTVTKLAGDKLLVAGGGASTAELYTPSSSSFTGTGAMSRRRAYAAAVLLPSGKVLITGGNDSGALSTTELYDPASGTFAAAAPMLTARVAHAAYLLPTGRVIALGGSSTMFAELYDSAANTWTDVSTGATSRSGPVVGQLGDGRVVAAGGNGSYASTAEIFDGAKWTATAALPREHRFGGFSATLSSGALLVMGGAATSQVDTLDPSSAKWSNAPDLLTPRDVAAAVRLNDGRVLVAGGETADPFGGGVHFAAAELFAGEANGKTCAKGGDCTSGACVDGVCCDRACEGQCEACDLAGKLGTCSFVTGAPHGTRPACAAAASCAENSFTPAALCDGAGKCAAAPRDCGGFKCTSEGCRTSCTDPSHCAANYTCDAGKCVAVASAACEQPGLGAQISAGVRTACNAYLCDPGTGLCRDKCSDSSHCAKGFVCGSGACQPQPAAEPEDDGGCAYGPRGGNAFALLALIAIAVRRRA